MLMKSSSVAFCSGCLVLLIAIDITRRHFASPAPDQSPAELIATAAPAENNGAAKIKTPSPVPKTTPISGTAKLIQQILGALNSTNAADQEMIFTNQLIALIKTDPWAAAHFAESADAQPWRTELMRVVAKNWASTDPNEAAKWVAQLSDPGEKDTMLSCVCFETAQNNVQQAIQIVEQQGLDTRREVMLGNLAEQWATNDFPGALDWAENYPPGDSRDNLLLHIVLTESRAHPQEAADIVATQITTGNIQEEAAYSVVDTWAWQDLAAAKSWVNQFPEGELKERALNQISRIASAQTSTLTSSGNPN